MYIYLNQQLVTSEQATISIFDHGYLYGVGLFETFRTYEGKPFLLEQHLERLEKGCQQIGMLWEKDEKKLREQIEQLLVLNQLGDGYFRYNLSAGVHPLGLPTEPYVQLTELLLVKPLPPSSDRKRLMTVQTHRNTPEGLWRLKSHHYLNSILAKKEVPPGVEGIQLTPSGIVAEGIVSNVFFVHKGTVHTPSVEVGILDGITRQWVIQACKEEGIPVQEGEYTLPFALQADEVCITNSIQEIVWVEQWDDQVYPPLEEGSIILALQKKYRKCTMGY